MFVKGPHTLLSLAVGLVTDDSALGYIAGGSLEGAVIGEGISDAGGGGDFSGGSSDGGGAGGDF